MLLAIELVFPYPILSDTVERSCARRRMLSMAAGGGKVSVNISVAASGHGLHEALTKESGNFGVTLSHLVAAVYKFAVGSKELYETPLKDSRAKPGKHISASVTIEVRDELNNWADDDGRDRTHLCCFILEKTLEDGLLTQALARPKKRGLASSKGASGSQDEEDERDPS